MTTENKLLVIVVVFLWVKSAKGGAGGEGGEGGRVEECMWVKPKGNNKKRGKEKVERVV